VITNDRLCRQGRAENPYCNHCGHFDDLTHKLFECDRISGLWMELKKSTPITVKDSLPDTLMEASTDPVKLTFLTQCLHCTTVTDLQPTSIPGIIAKKLVTQHNEIRGWKVYLEE